MDKKKKSEELFKVIKEITFKKEEKGKRVKVTLGETSEYLENLLDYASAPIIVWNPQYEIIRFNKAFEFITGRTEKDVIGKSLEILFPPALRDCSMELIKNTIMGNRLEAVEINIVHTGGSVFTLLWNSAPIKSSDGKTLIATIAQGQDITQRKQAEELIKENEKRFRELLESLPQLFWTCRADGFCDYLSKQWVKYTGIPEAEQLGYRWLEQLHEEDKERTNADWGEKVKTGDDFNIEFRIRRNDGVYHWFKTRAIPMRDAEGNIIKWFGSNTDFDEIKKAEEEIGKLNLTLEKKIKQSEQRAAELVIANKELAFQNEEKGKRADELILANKELAFQNREKEKRADELIMANKELAFQNREKEKRADELILANKELAFQSEEKGKRADELILANKELAFQNEEKGKRADELILANKELAFQNEEKGKRAAELINANKELNRLISERKQAEDVLRESEENLNEAQKIAKIGNWEFDVLTQKIKWSEQVFLLYERDIKLGPPTVDEEAKYYTQEEAKILRDFSQQSIETGLEYSCEIEPVLSSGRKAYMRTTMRPVKDDNGKIVKLFGVVQDITDRKQAEEKIIIANRELAFQNEEKGKRAAELIIANKELAFQNEEKGKRADELALANKELAFQNKEKEKRAAELIIANKELAFQVEVNKVLEQFTYVVSHNLQEPLRTVSNYIQVLNEDYSEILDDKARKYLHLVDDSTKRMSTLLNTLADISRLGRNIKLSQVDCKKVVDEVIADLATLIKTSNAKIEVTDMPVLNAYEVEMRQLFQNQITNAIKFRRKNTHPEIQIRSEKINEKWKFSVSDNGIGIAPVHFQRIFDIFQRLHTDAEYEGNGIGLSNCKKIVQLHHGEIWIESNIGQGSTFHFTIPNLAL